MTRPLQRGAEAREAGHKLDMLIAEKVMGWELGTRYGNGNGAWKIAGQAWPTTWEQTPFFSTEIAAAWRVVEKLRAMGYRVITTSHSANADSPTGFDYGEQCCFAAVERHEMRGVQLRCVERHPQYAPTIPLAVCLAALRTVESEQPSPSSRETK